MYLYIFSRIVPFIISLCTYYIQVIWVLCMASSGATSGQSTSTCTRTTPARSARTGPVPATVLLFERKISNIFMAIKIFSIARAWTSWRRLSTGSRPGPATGGSSCAPGTPRTWTRWRCRPATASSSSTWRPGNSHANSTRWTRIIYKLTQIILT